MDIHRHLKNIPRKIYPPVCTAQLRQLIHRHPKNTPRKTFPPAFMEQVLPPDLTLHRRIRQRHAVLKRKQSDDHQSRILRRRKVSRRNPLQHRHRIIPPIHIHLPTKDIERNLLAAIHNHQPGVATRKTRRILTHPRQVAFERSHLVVPSLSKSEEIRRPLPVRRKHPPKSPKNQSKRRKISQHSTPSKHWVYQVTLLRTK